MAEGATFLFRTSIFRYFIPFYRLHHQQTSSNEKCTEKCVRSPPSREMFKGSTAKTPLSQVLYSYVAWLQQLVENGYFDTGVTSGSFNMSRRWQGVRIFRMQLAVSMFIQRKPGNKRDPTTNVCAQKLLIDDLGESCRLHSQTKQFLWAVIFYI